MALIASFPRIRIRPAPAAALALAASLALPACGTAPHRAHWALVREITPRFLDSLAAEDPAVACDEHGRVALTWVVRDTRGGRDLWLAVSSDTGATFAAPARVNPVPGLVVSFPEGRATPVFGPAGALAVAWTEHHGGAGSGFDLPVRASGDGGATLGAVAYLNDDHAGATPIYRGFHALAYRPDGTLFAAWLDGREFVASKQEAAGLWCATSPDGGAHWSANRRMRDTVCSCCRPAAAIGDDGEVAVAYRAAYGNLRDPALAVSHDGGITFASDSVLSRDRWYLTGCPVVGPALTWTRDDGGLYAWFTGAEPRGVYVVPWRATGGAAGVRRALADSVVAPSHPRAAPFGRKTLLGVEARPAADTTQTMFAVRALDRAGTLTPWMFLGAGARDAWLAGSAAGGYACWVEREGGRSRVRLVRLLPM